MITYLIINDVTGDTYVGRTKLNMKKRWGCHKSSARRGVYGLLYDQIREYGEEVFKIEVLCEGNKEKHFINKLQPTLNLPPSKNYLNAAKVNSKKCRCIETGIIYNSSAEAERLLGLCHSGISNMICGKSKSCGGFTWEYI